MTRPRYYHWTCWHGAAGIHAMRRVTPHLGLSWWTDLQGAGRATRTRLGLTSTILTCDRMSARFQADPRDTHLLIPWADYRREVAESLATQLESTPGVAPDSWWVATEPVRVVKR
jgi:hypothetical protein